MKLRFNAGDLWGYDCMGAGSCGSIGVNEALVVGGGNGRKGSIRDDWRSNSDSGFRSFGRFNHISICFRLMNRYFLGVGVAYLDGLDTNITTKLFNYYCRIWKHFKSSILGCMIQHV